MENYKQQKILYHKVKHHRKKTLPKKIIKTKKSDRTFEAQGQSLSTSKHAKKVLNIWIKLFAVFIIFIVALSIIAGKNSTTAEILIDEFVDALKSELGFDYDADPQSDYVFSRNTPNYNAFAADKKLAGTHRMLLERNGLNLEVKFKSAEKTTKPININSDLNSTESADLNNPIQKTLDNLNSELDEITSGLQDISEKISSLQQEVSEISSKAKMIPVNDERKVQYQDIVYGTDIVYGLSEAGMEQEIIVKNKENLNNIFNFSLKLPDFSYKDVGRGVWYFYNQENQIMRIPKAYAIDANGKFTNDVYIGLKTTLLVTVMSVEIPSDWLGQDERAYPVTVKTAFEIVPSLRGGTAAPNGTTQPNNSVAGESTQISTTSADVSPVQPLSVTPTQIP